MKIKIEGGRPLEGEIHVEGAKNSALPIFIASLLTDDEVILKNIPDLKDVRTIIQMLERLGKIIHQDGGTYRIRSSGVLADEAPYELVRKMRASFLVLGPLLARLGRAKVPLPGGCVISPRPVDLHLKGLRALGAEVKEEEKEKGMTITASANFLKGAKVYLNFPSVGATEHIMMTAALIPERTVIENPALEPEISDLASFLRKMGAEIKIGDNRIEVKGAFKLRGATHGVIPDRINAGTYIIAAAISGGEVFVGCEPDHLSALTCKLKEIGVGIKEREDGIEVLRRRNKFKATQVKTSPYPGFPTDLQPQMTALLSLAEGESIIEEKVFKSRFSHVSELGKLGADIKVSGSEAVIRGVEELKGAEVIAKDIRAGAALVIGGLTACGVTTVKDQGHIERGYSDLVGTLRSLGAKVKLHRGQN
jgi:UDP-N-acetylglucosamine 1-carboxyvinyltransferase